jgi:hypothetical protein
MVLSVFYTKPLNVRCAMDDQIGPVRRGIRTAALLEGSAHMQIVRAARSGKIHEIHEYIAPLKLVKAMPSEVFDDVKDANYFVVRVESLVERRPNDLVIVDVSPQDVPRIVAKGHERYGELMTKVEQCKIAVRRPLDHGDAVVNILEPGRLDSIILGWLLGYPVVYWSNDAFENCLSDETLRVFALREAGRAMSAAFTSFSIPVRVVDNDQVKAALCAFNQEFIASGWIVCSETDVILPKVSL